MVGVYFLTIKNAGEGWDYVIKGMVRTDNLWIAFIEGLDFLKFSTTKTLEQKMGFENGIWSSKHTEKWWANGI